MNKLSKEKRNQLIIVLVGTVVVLALTYFFLIRPQYDGLQQIAKSKSDALKKLQEYKDAIQKTDVIATNLVQTSADLASNENDIASGDIYAWTYDTIRRFKLNYHVSIPGIGQPSAVANNDLFPEFPYKQISLSVNGTAFYHDLGKFIADFENKFPHMRVVNLTIEPGSLPGEDAEKLSFQMDIVVLVKTAS